jgi:hypothetical protein
MANPLKFNPLIRDISKPDLNRISNEPTIGTSVALTPPEFRTVNQNGNYRRGYQRYIRGGAPKGLKRNDEGIEEFITLATISRGWESTIVKGENEWMVEIIEDSNKKVIVHIPFNEDTETTFEWDAQ